MKNFCLILLILISFQFLCLVYCQNENFDENPCSNQSRKYKSFRSYLNFIYHKKHIQFPYEPRNFIIKETFHRNKGKLELENLNENIKETFIFDFDIQQMYIVNPEKKFCVVKIMTNTNKESSDLGFEFVRDENVIGVTAILNTLFGREGKRSENVAEHRGIEVDHCFFNETKGPKYEIILAKKFDITTEPVLSIKMVKNDLLLANETYSGEYFFLKKLDDDKELEEQIELDEQNEITKDKHRGFWHVPEYCQEKKQTKEIEPKAINLPDQYEFTFQRLIDNETKTANVMIDHKNKIVRFSRSDSNDTLILDIANHIQYELNLTTCSKKFNDNYENYESYGDLIEILNKLKQIRSTDYIGQRNCRDDLLVCDVFSFKSSIGDDSPDNIFESVPDDEDRRGRFFDSTLYTFSFYYDEQTKFHQLLQIKEQISYQEKQSKLIETIVYDVYDFKNLNGNYRKAIDLIDCSYGDQNKISIRMTGLMKNDVVEIEQSIERKTVDKIVEITNLTYYNIPRVETQINYDRLTMSLTLIQPINDLRYFKTFERYKIPLDYLKEQFNKRTLEECAFLAKKNEWVGFQYCQDDLTCYSVMNAELFYLNPVPDNRVESCITKKKILNSDYIQIPNAIKQIEKRIVNADFSLDDGFSFQSLDNEYEMNQKEKENHFNLIKDERCFNMKELDKKIECKLKPRLADCFLSCQSTNCAMFSLNKLDEDRLECCFVQQTYNDFRKQYESKLENFLIKNKMCSLYELTHLTMFNRLSYKKVDGEPLKSLILKSAEDCAIECSQFNKQNNDSQCLSFDHCLVDSGDYHCKLRSFNKNSLENQNKLIDSTECSFYSVNSLIDYHKTTFRQLDNFTVLHNYDLQDCAKECKHRIGCSKFNFCRDKGNLACLLETNQTMSKDHQEGAICTSYLTNERLILDDLNKKSTESKNETNRSVYVAFGVCLGIGLKIGVSIILVQRIIQKKRKSKAYYVKFRQEEDAISIASRKIESENANNNTKNQNSNQDSNHWTSIKQSLTENLNSFVEDNKIEKSKDHHSDEIETETSKEEEGINHLDESL